MAETGRCSLARGLVMLGQVRQDDDAGPTATQPGDAAICVVVPDPDAHHERAAAAGAQIARPLTEQDYGSREYSALDLEGNRWSFGTYDPYASE